MVFVLPPSSSDGISGLSGWSGRVMSRRPPSETVWPLTEYQGTPLLGSSQELFVGVRKDIGEAFCVRFRLFHQLFVIMVTSAYLAASYGFQLGLTHVLISISPSWSWLTDKISKWQSRSRPIRMHTSLSQLSRYFCIPLLPNMSNGQYFGSCSAYSARTSGGGLWVFHSWTDFFSSSFSSSSKLSSIDVISLCLAPMLRFPSWPPAVLLSFPPSPSDPSGSSSSLPSSLASISSFFRWANTFLSFQGFQSNRLWAFGNRTRPSSLNHVLIAWSLVRYNFSN